MHTFLKKPISSTATKNAPSEVPVTILVGRKTSIHCKSSSSASCLVYLTQGENPVFNDYTMEMPPGYLYEVPHEHSGQVWVAGGGGDADITITQYG